MDELERNPWFLAFAVIMSNIGVNYILEDLDERQKNFLNNCVMRKFFLFALVYCGTKNLMISVIATLIYSAVVHWM